MSRGGLLSWWRRTCVLLVLLALIYAPESEASSPELFTQSECGEFHAASPAQGLQLGTQSGGVRVVRPERALDRCVTPIALAPPLSVLPGSPGLTRLESFAARAPTRAGQRLIGIVELRI